MDFDTYKKYTTQAKTGIKGEAFFEALISDYSLPHRIVGPRDLGIDYICEWVYGDRPTGILYAVQIKTFPEENAKPQFIEVERLNQLSKFRISNHHLMIDEKTMYYWKGLGMPFYLFTVIQTAHDTVTGATLDCHYKRFTPVLTERAKQEDANFYKVNNGSSFIAFARSEEKQFGFARDLFIDYMRWCYYKGSITYLNPRTIGLNQFEEEDSMFIDLLQEYRERVCVTYLRTKRFLEQYCESGKDERT